MSHLYPDATRVGVFSHDSIDWHAARRKGLGGSDASVLLGHSRWKTPYELWRLKTGRDQPEDAGPYARLGNLLEDVIRDHAFDGLALDGGKLGSLRSNKYPHLVANVDGILADDADGVLDVPELLEIKTAGRKWPRNEVPAYYVDQVQHYMLVTGLRVTNVVCCVLDVDRPTLVKLIDSGAISVEAIVDKHAKLHFYPVEFDEQWAAHYLPIAQDFWARVERNEWEEVRYAF